MSKKKNKHRDQGGAPMSIAPQKVEVQPAVAAAQAEPVNETNIKIQPKSIEKVKEIMTEIQTMKTQNDLDEKFVNFLKGLPAMIMQNGLGQTVAFLQTKDEQEKKVANLFNKLLVLPGENTGTTLMDRILSDTVENYNLRQREAIEYAGWMKRFAVAFGKAPVAVNKDQEKKDA